MSGREALTFHWPERGISFLFIGFLLLSLFIHLSGFYLFQIVYPPSGPMAPPPATITVLDPANPSHTTLLSWIESEDPALVAAPQAVDPPQLLDVRYPPSYAGRRIEPGVPPLPDATPALGPVRSIDDIIRHMLRPDGAETRASVAAPATRIRVSPPLEARQPLPEIRVRPVPETELSPTTFLVGVDAEGEPCHLYLQASSGNDKIDAQARKHLRSMRFTPPGDGGVAFGNVTYFWSADATAPPQP